MSAEAVKRSVEIEQRWRKSHAYSLGCIRECTLQGGAAYGAMVMGWMSENGLEFTQDRAE